MTSKNKTEQNLPFSESEIHGYVELEDWQANVNDGSKLIYIQQRQTSERGRENYGAVSLLIVIVALTIEKHFCNFQIHSFTFIRRYFIPENWGECFFIHSYLSQS